MTEGQIVYHHETSATGRPVFNFPRPLLPLYDVRKSNFCYSFLAVVGADSGQDNVTIQRIEKMIKNSKTYN